METFYNNLVLKRSSVTVEKQKQPPPPSWVSAENASLEPSRAFSIPENAI